MLGISTCTCITYTSKVSTWYLKYCGIGTVAVFKEYGPYIQRQRL